jgi:hypothetical protein
LTAKKAGGTSTKQKAAPFSNKELVAYCGINCKDCRTRSEQKIQNRGDTIMEAKRGLGAMGIIILFLVTLESFAVFDAPLRDDIEAGDQISIPTPLDRASDDDPKTPTTTQT